DRDARGDPGGAAAGRHPRRDRRAAGRARAAGGRPGGALLRRQRAQRLRGRSGARRRHARRGPARDPLRRLHAPAGQGRGLWVRQGRQGAGSEEGRSAAGARRAARPRPRGRRAGRRGLPSEPRAAGRCTRRRPAGRDRRAGMIALLRGEVAVRRADHVVVLSGDVGYRAAVSAETLRHVPPVGEQLTLHTHLIVRDDALALYGFHSEQERELFLMLLGVQAVGPKVALAVLSAGPPRELLAALDAARFQAVPGICKRTAERIIVELREKVAAEGGAAAAAGEILARRGDEDHPRSLARAGLIELGYGPGEAD